MRTKKWSSEILDLSFEAIGGLETSGGGAVFFNLINDVLVKTGCELLWICNLCFHTWNQPLAHMIYTPSTFDHYVYVHSVSKSPERYNFLEALRNSWCLHCCHYIIHWCPLASYMLEGIQHAFIRYIGNLKRTGIWKKIMRKVWICYCRQRPHE